MRSNVKAPRQDEQSWETITEAGARIQTIDSTTRYVIQTLAQLLHEFFSYSRKQRTERTRIIKDALAVLGVTALRGKPSYRVYCNGLSEMTSRKHKDEIEVLEPLFDIQWFVPGKEPYAPQRIPLVAECEWNPRRKKDRSTQFSGIKYDFQKLLVANADFRLMIFRFNKVQQLEDLGRYFDAAITGYEGLPKGAPFLFVAFDDSISGFHYKIVRKE